MLLNDIVQAALEECPVENQKYTDEVAEEAKGQRVEFDTVTFVRCRFTDCDFTGASFCNVLFDNCDFSNCTFGDSYWKNTKAKGRKPVYQFQLQVGDVSGMPVPLCQFFHGILGIL